MGTYSSSLSQADADARAENNLLTNGQNYANTNGTCALIYYNTQQSQNFTTEGCGANSIGGTVAYTVAANKYSSTISQADANRIALDEIAANGYTKANSTNRACTVTTAPYWESEETAQTQCQKDENGNYTGHLLRLMTDVNSNSATYNTTQFKDWGPNESICPHTPGSTPSLNGTGYQTSYGSGVYTGNPGSTITVTVTLLSSDPGGTLSGNVAGTVQLSGSGRHDVTNVMVMPSSGYISWSVTLSGNLGSSGGYISSNISFQ